MLDDGGRGEKDILRGAQDNLIPNPFSLGEGTWSGGKYVILWMPYTILKKTGLDKNFYGYEIEYSIDFIFQKQTANVTIQLHDDLGPRLCSNTDGYHWLQFFLSQKPGSSSMEELPFHFQVWRCQEAFAPFGIGYEQEDKETAWLNYNKPLDEEFVKLVAEVIEPRFANRERFFDWGESSHPINQADKFPKCEIQELHTQ